MPPENNAMREALESAFEEQGEPSEKPIASEVPPAAEEGQQTGGSTENPEESMGTEGEKEKAPAPVPAEETAQATEEAEQSSAAGAPPAVASGKEDTGGKEGTPDSDTSLKAPSRWKPALREKWAALPDDVKAEISFRESATEKFRNEVQGERKVAQQFTQAMAPFQSILAANNADPIKTTQSLMQTAAGLQMGTPRQKAQIVSNIISQYGVDINSLDEILAGMAPKEGNQQMEELVTQRLAPMQKYVNELQQQQAQQVQQGQAQVATELSAFSSSKEFYEDLRGDMADIMEMSARRGAQITLEQAYVKAMTLNPDISKIVEDRKAASVLGQKRHAASSLAQTSMAPAGAPSSTGSVSGDLAAAYDAATGKD